MSYHVKNQGSIAKNEKAYGIKTRKRNRTSLFIGKKLVLFDIQSICYFLGESALSNAV